MVIEGVVADGWVTDSGCSFHMTPHKELLEDLRTRQIGTVKLGDDRSCDIWYRNVVSKLENGTKIKLQEVRYVPELK